jgi:hypothetical protein
MVLSVTFNIFHSNPPEKLAMPVTTTKMTRVVQRTEEGLIFVFLGPLTKSVSFTGQTFTHSLQLMHSADVTSTPDSTGMFTGQT